MATAPSAAPPSPTQRLRSIDALRGFDMFWIIGGEDVAIALVQWTGVAWGATVVEQLQHADWEGFRFYDLIFPLFLFLVGTVMPFSFASARQRGDNLRSVRWRIARRTLLLFALGLLCNGIMQFQWLVRGDNGWSVDVNNHLRVTGVLQRIAVCYGIGAMIALHTGPRLQLATVVVVLLGYVGILTGIPNPEAKITGELWTEWDVSARLSKEWNIAGYLDRTLLPGKILEPYYGYGDNEGLLSTIPAVATVLLGVLAGQWLRTSARPAWKVLGLVVAGLGCLVLGTLWSYAVPIIKNLWTSSFVLYAGGWSLLLLALFYGVIDGLGWSAWSFFFVVIGANAITIYVGQRIIDFDKIGAYFLGGIMRHSAAVAPLIAAVGALLAKWLFLLVLYRQRLFLRV